MKILVIGSGAREHAICWKASQSRRVDKIFAAPGNGGMAELAQCVDINSDDINALADFAKINKISVTITGPEAPLAAGIVNKFNQRGLRIFGPSMEMAKLEASKVFAKETMARLRIPTADFMVFDDAKYAMQYIEKRNTSLVIKADGLAQGKGVFVCKDKSEALDAVKMIMVDKKFGAAGARIIVEDCLEGEEASIIIISDGRHFTVLPSSQDHKRIYDEDKGPNTGGMGAYSPAPVINGKLDEIIKNQILKPVISGLNEEGTPFKGALYAGLMITKDGPKVLEFNVRFGDPETQAILPKLKTGFIQAVEASIDGNIETVNLEWDSRPCVCVVCASKGYPETYKKGFVISGLKEAGAIEDVVVFHAGTKLQEQGCVTSGGRVLGVTALGKDIKQAIERAYKACEKIHFDGIYYRKDIGYRALKRL